MNRLDIVKEYVNGIVNSRGETRDQSCFFIHLYGVAAACALLASKRGLDPEIASASGLMHDMYACWTGSTLFHAYSGAEMSRVALRRMGCFTEEEKLLIESSIFHHSDKAHVHDPYDELLKDADILQPYLQSGLRELDAGRIPRMNRMAEELGIPFTPVPAGRQDKGPMISPDRRKLADIAESLAQRNIVGSMEDTGFLDILKYWPEKEAFDELKNGWCAAFVYHCCMLAGFWFPIRHPGAGVRFAGVGAWLEWATLEGFYFNDLNSFAPDRGDIVIYNNVIPTEKKPADSLWHDHIGIVLAAYADTMTVAEGNAGNDNVSAILCRSRNKAVGGFVRIPDGYRYDGGKFDYKTKQVRIDPYLVE